MAKKIAVVGATNNVGNEILSLLSERKFPVDDIIALDLEDSVGKEVSYGFEKRLTVKDLITYDFAGTDIAFFFAGDGVSEVYGKKAAKSGCIVIDGSSYFRMDKDIPLVVCEANGEEISKYKNQNIIAVPNSSVCELAVVLKPLSDLAKIRRVVVSTYQAVSGMGMDAMDELFNSTKKIYENDFVSPVLFKKEMPFNLIPQIGIADDNGSYSEENEIVVETKKVMGDENMGISATCVMVPVFACYSESVNIEFDEEIDVEEVRETLSDADGVLILDRPEEYVYATPRDCGGEDEVYVSRIRKDASVKNGLNMWIVADNIRKGTAINAVKIAEILVEKYGI